MPTEVGSFLEKHGLEMYALIMMDQGFDFLDDLRGLVQSDKEFAELVPPLGHRMRIRRLLEQQSLTAAQPPVPPSQPAAPAPPQPAAAQAVHAAEPMSPPRSVSTTTAALPHASDGEFMGGSSTRPHDSFGAATAAAVAGPAPFGGGARLRPTAAVAWLEANDLGMYARDIQTAGYDDESSLVTLLDKHELFEHLVTTPGHREKMRRLLVGQPAAPVAPPASAGAGGGDHAREWLRQVQLPNGRDEDLLSAETSSEASRPRRFAGDNVLGALARSLNVGVGGGNGSVASLLPAPAVASGSGGGVNVLDVIQQQLRKPSGTPATTPVAALSAHRAAVSPGRSSASSGRRFPSAAPAIAAAGGPARGSRAGTFYDDASTVAIPLDPAIAGLRLRRSPSPPPLASPPTDFQAGAPPPQPRAGDGETVMSDGRRAEANLFVRNPGLEAALRGRDVPPCADPRCGAPDACGQLHYRTLYLRFENRRVRWSARHVASASRGLRAALSSALSPTCVNFHCNEGDNCCGVHMAIHLPPCADARDPTARVYELCELSFTKPLGALLEMNGPPQGHERRQFEKVRLCPSFTASQTCVYGSNCRNLHALPDGNFSRAFFRDSRDALNRLRAHCASPDHCLAERWDLERTVCRPINGLEIGEAVDFLVNTTCTHCQQLLFTLLIRPRTRRSGCDLLWALLGQLADGGAARLTDVYRAVNNTMKLTRDEQVGPNASMFALVNFMAKAIYERTTRTGALNTTTAAGSLAAAREAHVFWDFDNVLLPDRDALQLFYTCLTLYLLREGAAANKNRVHVTAFGTKFSFTDEVVDALRDLNVVTRLCASKKAEETDRQMERQMQQLQGKADVTAVVISSDKDFVTVAKQLAHSGVDVLLVHDALPDSRHLATLQLAACRSVSMFDVYWSALKQHVPRIPEAAAAAAAAPAPQKAAVAMAGRANGAAAAFVDPAVVTVVKGGPSNGGAAATAAVTAAPAGGSVTAFFQRERERQQQQQQRVAPPATVQPLAVRDPAVIAAATASAASVAAAGSGLCRLAQLLAEPRPPARHRAWYVFFMDAYLLRLTQYAALGQRRGPYVETATVESATEDAEVFLLMALGLPNLLPPWFETSTAIEVVAPRFYEPPDAWITDAHLATVVHPSQVAQARLALKHLAALVDGPLGDDDNSYVATRHAPLLLQF